MKRIKSVLLIVLALTMLASFFTIGAGASSAYQTYTYSIEGKALYSPDAYNAEKTVDASTMGVEKLNNPGDMVTDDKGQVYIANTGNNEIIVLSRYYEKQAIIKDFINDKGNPDTFDQPQGVFVTSGGTQENPNGEIWVCDTNRNRLVVFDRATYEFLRIIDQPQSQLFDDDAVYKPVAMAIDQYGRIYVVSSTTYQGVIVMDSEGAFVGFIGAQAVTISAWEILWRRFQTEEQRKLSQQLISTEFNNITITEDGFIYVTTSSIEASSVEGAIRGKSTSGKYMPVKLLNPAGVRRL